MLYVLSLLGESVTGSGYDSGNSSDHTSVEGLGSSRFFNNFFNYGQNNLFSVEVSSMLAS